MANQEGKQFATAMLLCALCVGAWVRPVSAITYYVWDDWGGSWADAEKSAENLDDDLMCWAAAASNILEWTGWGRISSPTLWNTDQIFRYFQDHWTDETGNAYVGVDWWFDGTNLMEGVSGWAQVDVAGGGFYDKERFTVNTKWTTNDASALPYLDTWLHNGYGTTLSISGPGAHVITAWGYEWNDVMGMYSGIWVTDSDDDQNGEAPRPDTLRYYDVVLSGDRWFLQDYAGVNTWYISEVLGLKSTIPEPGTIILLGSGLVALAGYGRKRKQ